jgi:membrane fusion protein, multidrug efflux system
MPKRKLRLNTFLVVPFASFLPFLPFIPFILLFSCTTKPNYEEQAQQATQAVAAPVAVEVVEARVQPFSLTLLANGRVVAQSQSKLNFRSSGVIEKILVKNGGAVQAGQLMAQLENREARLAVQQAALQVAEARVEINDLLISQGGRKGDSTSVKPDVWAYIKLRSGYERAVLALQKAQNDLENTYLRAPYAGVVANLKVKPYNSSAMSEAFCTLLSREAVWVEFSVLETELSAVQIGQIAQVTPVAYNDKVYRAQVIEINPLVNEQGLVQVKAKIQNADKQLFEGMNARVRVEKPLAAQLVVPKEAVVERSGRKVVFTYEAENDTLGLAKWHYVTVIHENETQVTISEGLKAGEKVIVEGNLNLGHDAKVRMKEMKGRK